MIFRIEQHLSFSRVSLAACLSATCCFAGWFGAGVSGGTGGTNINDTANWTGGVINGDFSGITAEGTTALVLTNDIAFADGTTQTRTDADLSFASNATEVVFTSVDGIEVGQTVNGANVYSNTFLIALNDTNGTLSRATRGVSSGTYTFVRPALNFNFGVLGSRATNVTVTIGSDPVGTTRILSLNGRLCQSQNAIPTNQVVFSSDIGFTCTGAVSVAREDGAITTNGIPPLVIVNGPVALGDVGSITTRLTLDGGSLALAGVVSGVNARLNVCSSTNAGTLTLLNPENSFSGGLTSAGGGTLVVNSSRVLANREMNSAMGKGGSIDLNDTFCTLQGFTGNQVTDRPWNVGGKNAVGPRLFNYGTAPLELTGLIHNDVNVEDAPFFLYSSYQNRGTPNLISGHIKLGSKVLAIGVQQGTWRLTNPTNSFNGSLRLGRSNGATLQLTSLSNTGSLSAGGTGSIVWLDSPGGSTSMNVFEYLGANNASCNREFKHFGNTSEAGHNAVAVNGLGSLTLTGKLSNGLNPNWGGLQTRTLHLLGTGTGRFSGTGALADVISGGNTGRIALVKGGAGTWTLAGSSLNHQGYTDVRAGNLILDYTSYDQLTASTNVVRVCGGDLTFKAKPSGTTADTLSAYQLGLASTSGGTQYRSTTLKLDANGGNGFALTVQSLAGDDEAQKLELVDLSSSAGNSITANALGWRLNVVYGVLMDNASSTSDAAARSTIVLRTVDGYGFPTLSGGSSGTLLRLSGQQALPTTGYNVNSNYILNVAGTVTPEADPNFTTLTVDTTAGASMLALGARKIACSGAGRGLLFSGPNDATLSGTGTASHVSAGSLWFHNYLETNATLHAALNLAVGGPHVLWGGTGFAVYSGVGLGNNFHLAGGIFRMTTAQMLTFPGKLFLLASGGVFEIGADLNGGAAGDFNCPVGAPYVATTNVALYGDTGLSAADADRTVNFGGAGATLTWGAGHFLTFYDGTTDYGYTFKLSSPYSDATVEIQNPIDLNGNGLHGRIRTVEVANGSAAVDARLSGTLNGNAALAKSGPGTLELTGAQTYDGPLMVLEGMLRTGADTLFADTLTVQLRGGGLAAGSGANAFGPLELYANAVIDAGDGTASLAFADSSACAWSGTLTINGTLGPHTLRFGTDANGLTPAQIAAIRNRGRKVTIDAEGYLHRILAGTLFSVR
ncbi:MAG TPA: autotransporter-associated beta strand repeat-containing protein [Kiritimatiellia bacterium]|nr:autotransporter-associated beta strand repeat-containing protein [Kiritimatiellia bacterium]